ncbi:Eco57I restriction-modification methylase domain-containing protein [Intestinibacter bartlettii]|uniref:Eco57I restriction-modification methylase domain-containing protein n=1 Tax=Intestinibacter bartlettii TaxID=261299 RepID=UPI00352086DB
MSNNKFINSFDYKVIYIFEIQDEVHRGLLKIGDATLKSDTPIDKLPPNCKELNQAALKRIKSYTNTAGITPKLLYTELAIRTIHDKKDGLLKLEAFRDHDVHSVLKNSGISYYKKFKGSTGKEWFQIDLQTALNAIEAVKNNSANLSNTENVKFVPIVFRPEQLTAIEKTVKHFKKANRMLWNAKMRFGKTISALEVIRRVKFKKTIIVTHRPVVNEGWYEDFQKVFHGNKNYIYGSKANGYTVEHLLKFDKNFVYFASIQDLRGSSKVGGKFDKNKDIFDTNWDCVIVDEAHEGTQTALGDEVIKLLVKEDSSYDTKFLALSGTPFNILGDFEDNSIYTWDYIMEQESKYNWDIKNFGDSNPYDELPELRIYTYDLGDIIADRNFVSFEDKAFNFHEFFRTWTGDYNYDYADMGNAKIGDFVHENDIWSFLNLMSNENETSCYPYSSLEYRDLFKHTLWMVPGVREAKALKNLMMKHPVFGSGQFNIVNVAGEGNEEERYEDALSKVKNAIKNSGEGEYTITLSCGKLTTGVTIREWTGVFMLSGSFSTSAANYLQTIFRVQSPANINGKIKETSYVFDFAPDRTLKMVASAVAVSTKAGKGKLSDKKIIGKFLNYCPVISISGSEMHEYNTNKLLQQLKRAYAEKVVKSGFDDINLYNDELLKLNDIDIEKFDKLKGIIGKSKENKKANDIKINEQGLTNEEYEELEKLKGKKKKQRTPEEEERLKELNKRRKLCNDAISILRGISIRMPLLIYGAEIDFDDDITVEQLSDIVDDSSWEEFMPKGITKEIFKDFIKYYDEEIFIAAGRRIRNIAKEADSLEPTERVKKIAQLFSYFKNPDKETVLTPWRVVNMHMSDCFGGYDFFNENHTKMIEQPRYIDQGKVTKETLNKNSKVLEINSKTGLYPLYVAYSIYRDKCKDYKEQDLNYELKEKLWLETVKNNIFVVCKTPMAKLITKRTLVGFKDLYVNTRHFDDLINQLKNKSNQFIDKITNPKKWKLEGENKMEFNAIVGNPPYQQMDGGNGASSSPVYNYFIEQSKKINPKYLSMIIPARWYVGGKGLDNFRADMLSDKHIKKLVDYGNSQDVFLGVDIAGGICYFLWDRKYNGLCEVKSCSKKGKEVSIRYLDEYNIFIRYSKAIQIINKVININKNNKYLNNRVSSRKPFGLPTNYKPKNKGIPCWFIQKIGLKYAKKEDILDNNDYLGKWKLLAPKSPIAGQTDFTKPVGFYYEGNTRIAKPGECCTESYIILGAFDTEEEVVSFRSYIFTKIVRFLLLQTVASQDVTKKNFCFIPDLEKYDEIYTDERLKKLWGITDEEWKYIDSRICNIGK